LVDEYQVTYEYSAGNSISFRTDDLKVTWVRPGLKVHTRVDGTRVVRDTGAAYRVFSCTAFVEGADADEMDTVQMGAITYSGAYPRLTVLYWNGTTTETNIEVACTEVNVLDRGMGWWLLSLRFEEKDQ
jgi:hypothetical protein